MPGRGRAGGSPGCADRWGGGGPAGTGSPALAGSERARCNGRNGVRRDPAEEEEEEEERDAAGASRWLRSPRRCGHGSGLRGAGPPRASPNLNFP